MGDYMFTRARSSWLARMISILLPFLPISAAVSAGDFWIPADDPSVLTHNDCGAVTDVTGSPVIRRDYMSAKERGLEALVADRLHTGDTVETPPGASLEWVCGSNIVVTLGADSQVRLRGLRKFPGPVGESASRLDVELLHGEVRVQARLNTGRPESVLLLTNGAEVLVRRGDVYVANGDGREVAAIGGSADIRLRRGDGTSAPFALPAGNRLGSEGPEPLRPEDAAAARRRLQFSFEKAGAALPPVPATSSAEDAP